MIDISLKDIHKYYGSNHVIQGVSLEINSGERVGLLGRNGSGKTTLFRIITGCEPYESGTVSGASGRTVEMLAQIPVFGENDTAEDVLRSSFAEITELYNQMKKIEGDPDPAVLLRYGRLMERYEGLGGYETEVRLDKICSGMNIDERLRAAPFSRLSGGEQSRVNLARILLRDCDVLLLDEPTNHLDLASLEWLERFLLDFSGTVVVISHDRVFLDRVTNRIIEIDHGKAHFYAGNYSFYVEEKQRRFSSQQEQYERQQKEIKRLEDRAKWLVVQNRFTTKHHALLSRIDHMEKIDKPNAVKKLTGGFDSGGYASKEIVSFESVGKGYGAKVLFDDLNLKIRRNDRIALVGDNGCGKTTLMKLIMGEETADGGEVKVSANVRPGYMPQTIVFDQENATVLDTLRYDGELSAERARSILAGFRFGPEDVYKQVKNLSGGEKSRLKLCMLMQKSVNLLLLDEPTNHLDIDSREWMENALDDFEGTMLFVSHDRYFLERFARRVWHMENGGVTSYDGGFPEYRDRASKTGSPAGSSAKKRTKPAKGNPAPPKATAKTKSDTSAETEALIHEAEDALRAVESEVEADAGKGDFSRMDSLLREKDRLAAEVDALYRQWMEEETALW